MDVPPNGQARSTIWSIQYLRAVAAIGVVVFHTLTETGFDFDFGGMGVDLFFGISGFLMYYVTQARGMRPLPFLWRRFLRIAPLYWFATLIVVAGSFLMPGFFWQASHEVRRIVLSFLFIPQNGVDGDIYPVLYVGWTLQYEVFFYLIFAASMLVPGIWRLIAMTATIGALTIIGWAAPESQNPLFLTYTNPIALEFVAGAWVGWACTRRWPGGAAWRAAYAAALAGGWVLLWAAWRYQATWDWSSAVTIVAIALILAGSVLLERHNAMPKLRWLLLIGEASYAIYLFQEIGFASIEHLITGSPLAVRAIAQTASAVLVGLLVHIGIERPFDRLVRRRFAGNTGARQNETPLAPAGMAPSIV